VPNATVTAITEVPATIGDVNPSSAKIIIAATT
jgi:hypothetical protein